MVPEWKSLTTNVGARFAIVETNRVICDATDATDNVGKICLRSMAQKNFKKRFRFVGVIKHENTIYQISEVKGIF